MIVPISGYLHKLYNYTIPLNLLQQFPRKLPMALPWRHRYANVHSNIKSLLFSEGFLHIVKAQRRSILCIFHFLIIFAVATVHGFSSEGLLLMSLIHTLFTTPWKVWTIINFNYFFAQQRNNAHDTALQDSKKSHVVCLSFPFKNNDFFNNNSFQWHSKKFEI